MADFTTATEAFETMMLERLKVGMRQALPAYVADSAQFRTEVDRALDHLVIEMRSHVLAERVGHQTATGHKDVEFFYPASWWQHWKRDHATRWYARWLVKRRPVKLGRTVRTARVEVPVEQFRTFPDATVRYPDNLGSPVRVVIPGQFRWAFDDEVRHG